VIPSGVVLCLAADFRVPDRAGAGSDGLVLPGRSDWQVVGLAAASRHGAQRCWQARARGSGGAGDEVQGRVSLSTSEVARLSAPRPGRSRNSSSLVILVQRCCAWTASRIALRGTLDRRRSRLRQRGMGMDRPTGIGVASCCTMATPCPAPPAMQAKNGHVEGTGAPTIPPPWGSGVRSDRVRPKTVARARRQGRWAQREQLGASFRAGELTAFRHRGVALRGGPSGR
jgi:hypothetical protein